ncbi:RNA polymerase sigma factor, sigma-70 family [Xanthomonas vesicatoria ATCC 35937]|uniref:RNA polymerase sigma factor, sigma-70 family n=1 Tax=Xanthomonas vesicatoria ATCC 35937 TaxID=925775 RepID=F0BJK2_9XANT|nr:RNA polymerase sigma factor, sigma-70 family [Xanthomonas vesicatoria ATCC 35937]
MLDTSVPIDVLPCATPADRDDAALARAAAAGERAAYEAIYRRHSPRLYALVWRLCGGNAARADDVLQDTFIAAWKALPQFRFQSALGTWLHRLAVNTALMELRARAAFGDHSSDDSEAMLAAVPDGAGCHSIRMDLERALEPRRRVPGRCWCCTTSRAGSTKKLPSNCRWQWAVRKHNCIARAVCCAPGLENTHDPRLP